MSLRIEGLCKAYGQKTVLRGFSHNFPPAGVVALMGPSGCGKTTLLRLIAGLERPDSGALHLPPGIRLSMVFQEDRLLPTLDARGNILAVLGKPTRENIALADYCLACCGLAGEERRYPAELSGGMRRRVAIARAVAYGGGLLLLDEPFRGLDAATRALVADFALRGESAAKRLTLLVTHSQEEAALADEVLRLG